MKDVEQYLNCRDGRWYYLRRVPAEVAELDGRTRIRTALKTSSLDVAKARRDSLAEADDAYWASLLASTPEDGSALPASETDTAQKRYKAAKKRAMARGFIYTPSDKLVQTAPTEELVERLAHIGAAKKIREEEVEAVLGTAKTVTHTVSQALELYRTQIAKGDLLHKSENQKRNWLKPKARAIQNFINLFGDLSMDKITREHARNFHEWWGERLLPKDGSRPLSADSAYRDIGNLRALFREYWEYEGEENRENPFRKLRFKDVVYKEVAAFSDPWVRSKLLKPDIFGGLNRDAILIVYAMIETGCRPSELANLSSGHIHLDQNVPFIQIKPTQNRKLKSMASTRDIPLVGVSLEAMRRAPNGFAHYHDKGTLLSASLMKAFRSRKLFETDNQRIYSFRHAFEKRMLEANIDYGLRCLLMGHKNTRPSYGDGGSIQFRQSQLLKIAHPVPKSLTAYLNTI